MKRWFLVFAAAVGLGGAGSAVAQVPPDVRMPPAATADSATAAPDGACRRGAGPDDPRPRIGLVLGGGGARGLAHVAVLKELERQRIPVDCIAGTSFGALVGGMYAAGLDADQIEAELRALDWEQLFDDSVDRPQRSFRRKRDDDLALVATKPGIGNNGLKLAPGLLSGERILLLLEEFTAPIAVRSDFDALPIPFRAVATDLNTGRAVVLGEGNLALAIRSSLSIPGVFRPVKHGDRFLVDGGLANQVPIDVVRAMGADIVIAVDVSSPLRQLDESAGPLDIVDQVSGFMTVGSAQAQIATLGPGDVLIVPALGTEVTTDGFDQLETALRIGSAAMAEAGPRLAALALPPADYARLAGARPAPDPTPPVIDFVRMENRSRYADSVLLAKIDITPGQPLDTARLQRNLQHIYGMDTLDLVTYDVVEEGGQTGIVVTVVPHSYGPNYLEAGLSLYSDFGGDFSFSLRAGVLRAPVNESGGELRGLLQIGDEPGVMVDWYQPFGADGDWFLLSSGSIESPRFSAYDEDGERVASYRAPNWGGEIGVGREYGNYGAATVSLRRREGHAELELGEAVIDELDYDQGEAELVLTFDRIDSTWLPRAGNYAVFNALASRTALGADADFEQYGLDFVHARAIGRHSGFFGFRYHGASRDPVPVPSKFRLGGLTRFAGYRPNERLADNYLLGYGGYTFELGRVLNRPAVLGTTLEYGRNWDFPGTLESAEAEIHGSLYFGFDSWLGPLLFGYGVREGGEGIFLLELGRPR